VSKHFNLIPYHEELYIVFEESVPKVEIKSLLTDSLQKKHRDFNMMEVDLLSSANALKWSRIYCNLITHLAIR